MTSLKCYSAESTCGVVCCYSYGETCWKNWCVILSLFPRRALLFSSFESSHCTWALVVSGHWQNRFHKTKKKKKKNQKKKSFKVNIWHTVHVGRCATSIRGHFGCFLEQKHASVCFNTLRLYMYTAARHLRTKFHSIKPPLIIAKALKNKYFLSYKYQRGAKICHNKMLFKYWEWKRNTF